MSLPDEEIRSMQRAGEFLSRMVRREIKRLPKEVREEAHRILRHYPGPTTIEMFWRKP